MSRHGRLLAGPGLHRARPKTADLRSRPEGRSYIDAVKKSISTTSCPPSSSRRSAARARRGDCSCLTRRASSSRIRSSRTSRPVARGRPAVLQRHARAARAAVRAQGFGRRVEVLRRARARPARGARAGARVEGASRGRAIRSRTDVGSTWCARTASSTAALRHGASRSRSLLRHRPHAAAAVHPARRRATDASATRPCSRATARGRRGPTAGLHFDRRCSTRCARAASEFGTSRCTSAPARSSRCARATWPST
jgi:hypothetical protein